MPQAKPRTYVGLLAVLSGAALFLLVAPAVEQEAHLRAVRGSDPAAVTEALRRLCWVRTGVQGLDELLTTLPPDHRNEVLGRASDLGCLKELAPEHRATYFLMRDGEVDRAAGFAEAAIGPAIELLDAHDPAQRERAAEVLLIVSARLSPTQRARVVSGIEGRESSKFVDALRIALGATAPTTTAPLAAPPDMGQVEDLSVATEVDSGQAPDAARVVDHVPDRLVPALKAPTMDVPPMGVLYRPTPAPKKPPAPAAARLPPVVASTPASDMGAPSD